MSRFEQIKTPEPGTKLAAIYAQMQAAGLANPYPINYFTAQSTRPDILEASWGLVKAVLLSGLLPHTLKEMIILAISAQNHCRYCIAIHRQSLAQLGVPHDVIQSCSSDPEFKDLPAAQRNILHFALKAARSPLALSDGDFHALYDQNMSSEEILEVLMVVSFTQFLNSFADASGIVVDGGFG